MADIEEEILLQANLFLLFVLKRRQRQLQSVLDSKIFTKRQDKLNFSPIIRALWLRSAELSVRIKNIMGYISIAELWFPYDRWIANDRRRSQKTEHGSIFCDHDRRSVFPYDRRRSQNFLRSAIRDRLRSYGNQPLPLLFLKGKKKPYRFLLTFPLLFKPRVLVRA